MCGEPPASGAKVLSREPARRRRSYVAADEGGCYTRATLLPQANKKIARSLPRPAGEHQHCCGWIASG